MVSLHHLEEIVTVVYAPLKEIELSEGDKWLWYDINDLTFEQPIDFIVIDGPPGATQHLVRYPTLPLLYNHLHDTSVIVLDDGDRKDEKEIVKLWKNKYSDITCKYIHQ